MQAFIGVTDYDWYRYLSAIPGIDEVNFWKPGEKSSFRALAPGEPFLFKLHAPHNAIVGGGFFAHFSRLPSSLAWDAFGQKNGAETFIEMRKRIERYRKTRSAVEDYEIGCILLEQPFFFDRSEWIPAPADWKPNIVQGRGYDLAASPAREIWESIQQRLIRSQQLRVSLGSAVAAPTARYGESVRIRPRLGQGSFRVMVTDAYGRRCAASGERTLPVLEAAHIKPFSAQGEHRIDNGLLLRSDLHTLYDRGYVTVTPEYRIEVSRRIREEFENGRDYYALHGRSISLPERAEDRPNPSLLDWHASSVFRR
jgi:putative restriction endonuclease